ncbi:MAG TPA: hypothetical protein VJ917_05850, partial [Saprospiraceae bacterium]|nr:hypothetical protein [Saprospiraceae bacterium]
MKKNFPLLLTLLLVLPFFSKGQVFSDEFGKNRVQYHERFEDWSYYESDHFISYWYGNGRNTAEEAARIAEEEIGQIERIIEYRLKEKIDLVVYNDLTDLHQSNIGAEETFNTRDNRFRILNNKMFVYNTGNTSDLRQQIREGIATILVNYNLYGENLKEIVQNSLFEDLPDWFKPGLIAYCGQSWNSQLDNDLRAFFTTHNETSFGLLAKDNPELAGHSFWYFVATVYGEHVISNLLYLIRINRDARSSFQYVLEQPLDGLLISWVNFYQHQYRFFLDHLDWENYASPLPDLRKEEKMMQGAWNTEQDYLAVTTDQFGKKRVHLSNLSTGKSKRIFTTGKINKIQKSDPVYPLIEWRTYGDELLIVYEKRDKIYHRTYSLSEGKLTEEKKFAPQIDRVIDLDTWSQDEIVLSGLERGHTNLYFFNTSNGQLRTITKDFFYEDHVRTGELKGEKGIFFSSDRFTTSMDRIKLDTIQTIPGLNAFFLKPGSKNAIQLSDNFLYHNREVENLDSNRYLFLSDESGIYNFKQGKLEKYIHHFADSVVYKNGDIEIIDPAHKNQYDTSEVKAVFRQAKERWRGSTKPLSAVNFNVVSFEIQNKHLLLTMDMGPNVGFYKVPQTDFFRSLEYRRSEFRKKALLKQQESEKETVQPDRPIFREEPEEKEPEKQPERKGFFFQSEFDKETATKDLQIEEKKPSLDTLEQEIPAERDSTTVLALETVADTTRQDSVLQKKYVSLFDDALVSHEDSIDPSLIISEEVRFKSSKIIPYQLKFKVNDITSDLENQPLVTGMEAFLAGQENNFFNPLGITFRAQARDILEDYLIEAGLRFPTTFDGQEYYLSFENRKYQLDKRYIFYRRTTKETESTGGIIERKNKLITTSLINQLKYPLSIFGSLRLTSYFRMDDFIVRSVNDKTLPIDNRQEQRLGARLEYVYDNTYDIDINLMGGLRYRVFVETIKKMFIDYRGDLSYSGTEGFSTIIGADFRYYLPVLRHSVLALRGASAISAGQEKVLFYLGGSRNWLVPQFDNSIPLPEDQFSFYSLASNVRGFQYNSRNGTS